ncbi:hypothetical protein [Microvirga sp. M2]|uniref:hypothetical protein n=1 Tax=Microvirga sp. M2 TaxID=3073270 RepID=UPI0039C33315
MKPNVVPMPPGIRAWKYRSEARSYAQAARVLGREYPDQMLRPRYFLLCHALELALKSFLAAHGADNKALRQISHDLSAAYDQAKVKPGFPISDKLLQTLVELMSPEHEGYWFRYPGAPYVELPKSDQCCDVIDEFLKQTQGVVVGAYKQAHLDLEAQNLEYDPELE